MHKPSSHSTRLVLSVLTIILAFLPITTFAQTEVSGEVSGEWTAEDSPYIVVDSTWVPEDEELRIGPGVDVLFGENIGLDVFGTLTAEGTEEDSVRFLPQNEDLTWKGIRLHTERTEHHFDYCLLQTIDRICIQVNSSQRIFVNHSNMLCSSVVIRGLLSEDAHAIYLIVTHSNLISDGAGIFLSFSRMEASDCNFYCDGLNVESIRLERCFVSGPIDTWHSVYIDCEFVVGDWFTVFMGDNALMENCTVEGELRINNGENMQISNSVITGAVHGSDFTGTIIDTEFNTTRSSRFESSEIDFRGCVFNGFFRFSPICMNIDRCRFYGKVSINSTDRNDEETVTINRCLIIGFTSLIRIIDNFYFTNNTVLYDSCGNQDTWEPLFSFQLEEPYECQIFNNLLIAAQDSCQLFKFIMDTTFPEVSYNCIYGFDYILHSSNRSQNTPFTLNETNILSNPRLMSVENQDFTLDWNSPCIDAGDPNSPLDPDSTRADIGAFYRDRNMYVSRNVESITNCMESLSFYPNPFNSSININFALPFCSFTAISITDLSGRNVATLLNERIPTGTHHVNWDAVNYPAGVYFVKMNCNGKSMLKKIVLIE